MHTVVLSLLDQLSDLLAQLRRHRRHVHLTRLHHHRNHPSGSEPLPIRATTKAQARAAVSAWIEEYNHDRRHSSIGMISPIAYELALTRPVEEVNAA
ncbi:integrase core domain-containing protein [Agromyces italicus]|uniref:integrase core domain-containing protein n=1 Tax=Agromyces italicus TaxID=279572 RepID=UPI003D15FD39